MNQDQLYAILKVVLPIIASWLAAYGIQLPDSITPPVIVGVVTLGCSVWAAVSHSDRAKLVAAAALPNVAKILVAQNAPPSSAAAQVAADTTQPKVVKN